MKYKLKEYVLYDLANWQNGLAFRDINFSDAGKPVIKINELKNGITSQTKFTKDNFEEKYYLTKGDMLFSWSGSPETSIDIFQYSLADGWLNQHIFKVTPSKNIDFHFLYFLLKYLKPEFIRIAKNRQTTGLGHVTVSDLKEIIVNIPASLEEQKTIVAFLKILDTQIRLFENINFNLEQIIQTIFKSWFIDFDGQTEFVDSELGKIPKGWIIQKISDLQMNKPNAISMGPFGSNIKSSNFVSSGIPVIQGKNLKEGIVQDFDIFPFLTEEKANQLKASSATTWDIVFTHRGTLGQVAIIPKSSTFTNYIISQSQMKLSCEIQIIHPLYVFLFFLSSVGQERLLSHTSSTGVPAISQPLTSLKEIKLIIPPKKVESDFLSVALPIFEKICQLKKQINYLSKINSSLLPKLMSGELVN